MANLKYHFKSITYGGFDAYREPLEVRFVSETDRRIRPFSVKFVDGFTKSYVSQSQPFVITWNFACKFICNIWQVLNCGSVQTSLTPFQSSLILTP